MKCGARIECITPDGQAGHVARVPAVDPSATALVMEDDTVTCLLQAGQTAFVIELPQTASLDRFTFLNENSAVKGELKISVSDRRLPANSREWVPVEGNIPFAHKRLFGVSLLGIEARFVRLTFQVENEGRIAARASYEKTMPAPVGRKSELKLAADTFDISALDQAINSKFDHSHPREPIVLSSDALSVGPLTSNAQ